VNLKAEAGSDRGGPRTGRTANRMDRIGALQSIIDRLHARTYLEIGVASGDCFLPLRARRKIAVDPVFDITREKKLKWMARNPYNVTARYYQIPSDHFFDNVGLTHRLDVVFIDGLHTYAQSRRDVENSLSRLSQGGVIVMHDCNPPSAVAATPLGSYDYAALSRHPDWTGEWCGDVWKTICYLRACRNDLKVFVLDCDLGLGIVTRGANRNRLDLTAEELRQLTYDDLAKNRVKLLDLKVEDRLFEFLASI
jgi:hypothetical protein